jgi:hypothetical protein
MEYTSRYYNVDTADYVFADGRHVAYRRRRFLPGAGALQTLTWVTVEGGDRLDLITAASLGDPELYWQICDANDVLRPDELEVVGRRLHIPLPRM